MTITGRWNFSCVVIAVTLVWASTCLGQTQDSPKSANHSLGVRIANSQVRDIHGTQHSLFADDATLTVVVFLGWECPLVRQYVPRLKELRSEFANRGVRWLAINSNQQDSLAELQHFARTFDWQIPILKDAGNQLADEFGAQRTPEVFLLDRDQTVVYQGRIDDQFTYGRQRPDVVTRFLADAIQETLQQQPVSLGYVEPAGCIIGRLFQSTESPTGQAITYSNQVSRIMQKNCATCHRPGEIGPFPLLEYDEVVGWAGMIQEVVNERRMPPWHANPAYGTFSNDCRLSEDEIEIINQWVEAGAPEGDLADLPGAVSYTEGWQIGQPDLVIPMSQNPYQVPATGTVEYEHFKVDPGFQEDKWICAAECRAGNRAVIHHIIVGVLGEGDFARQRGGIHEQVQSDWIAASAPGSPPMILPPGYAKFVPAGSKLVFQLHYTPNGTATEDISSIGLKFIDPASVTHRVLTLKAANTRFEIPAGAENHPVAAKTDSLEGGELLSLFPHMHLRGKSFRYTAVYPDSDPEVLLDVPTYDFNWQNAYLLGTPKALPAGTVIRCQAHFDNSDNNLANPDAAATVRWGDQTWEEMMIGYFNLAVPVSPDDDR